MLLVAELIFSIADDFFKGLQLCFYTYFGKARSESALQGLFELLSDFF